MSTDAMGDRMKDYERRETSAVFIPMIPIYARLDGIGFSSFTKGFDYPYDERLREALLDTTAWLVEHSRARVGYTQSDEISLCWLADAYDGEVFFSGKKSKMMTALASGATARFTYNLYKSGDPFLIKAAEKLPRFDARVYQLPNKTECANTFLWREFDATKNALQMAARAYYPYKQLVGKCKAELHELLYAQGVNFNDYPANFKRGTYIQRRTYEKTLTEAELQVIPEGRRPASPTVVRRRTVRLDLPPLARVGNRVEVLFDAADPLAASTEEP